MDWRTVYNAATVYDQLMELLWSGVYIESKI